MGYNLSYKNMAPLKRKNEAPQRYVKKAKLAGAGNKIYNVSSKVLVSPFPATHAAKLKYFAYGNIDPAAAAAGSYNFRANDLFDPDFTGAGHQPRGFDQWMNMYQKFTVTKSKILVKFSTDVTPSAIVGVKVNTTTTTSTDITEYCEDRCVTWDVADDTHPSTCVQTYDAKEWILSPPLADDQQYGTSVASPANQVFYTIFVGPANPGENISCNFAAVIEYDVVFHDPVQPAIS